MASKFNHSKGRSEERRETEREREWTSKRERARDIRRGRERDIQSQKKVSKRQEIEG